MVFGRRREPLANATNYPVGTGAAVNDPVMTDNDPYLAGGKRHSLFGGRRNRNSLTNPPPADAVGNPAYGAGQGTAANDNYGGASGTGMARNGMGTGAAMGTGASMAGPRTDPQTGVTIPGSAGVSGPTTTASGHPVTPTSSNARSLRKSGKMDSLMGTLFCSQRLKMEGEMKQEQAHAMAYQAAELNEANRLEEEATARRERAVAHGAHPAHGTLGGADQGVGMGMAGGGLGTGAAPGTTSFGRTGNLEEPGMAGVGAYGVGPGGYQPLAAPGAGMSGTFGHGPMGTTAYGETAPVNRAV
ncbi:hypothetical protein DACRYDRAFT_103516 [Dacryopinax primogenitus]|uniref:Uncharacterized protein n=1 Tax=Dacryopinax primogenitus (strain DJM 731) TaxID=1858805 RepID=M5GD21_DACPD|nr:uncharacterized protein DACRYDRAFT_103516 [Dacryopinax primogenitus]EJU06570.1 hypothetical protein DACRYDRAFT_103516 [Dacryopinax primogenitus]